MIVTVTVIVIVTVIVAATVNVIATVIVIATADDRLKGQSGTGKDIADFTVPAGDHG